MTMRLALAWGTVGSSYLTLVMSARATKAGLTRFIGDLEEGGANEFLHFLQNVKLGDWHPREILKTAETLEQQRMSGDSVSQWAQACVEADAVIGTRGSHGNEVSHDLNTIVSATALHHAYTGFCNQNGLRPLNTTSFGKACREMYGQRKRLPPQTHLTKISDRGATTCLTVTHGRER